MTEREGEKGMEGGRGKGYIEREGGREGGREGEREGGKERERGREGSLFIVPPQKRRDDRLYHRKEAFFS